MAKKAVKTEEKASKPVGKFKIPRFNDEDIDEMAAGLLTGRWVNIPEEAVSFSAGLILGMLDWDKREIKKTGAILGDMSEQYSKLYLGGKYPLFTVIRIIHRDDWKKIVERYEEKGKALHGAKWDKR